MFRHKTTGTLALSLALAASALGASACSGTTGNAVDGGVETGTTPDSAPDITTDATDAAADTSPDAADASNPGIDAHLNDDAATSGLVTIPLSGCLFTGYRAPVTVNGQLLQLVIDTGSTDMAVALSTCSNCNTTDSLPLTDGLCSTDTVSSVYGDNSGWNGNVCSSSVAVGSELPAVTIQYAGITSNNSFFRDYDCDGSMISASLDDGIIGLGPLDLDDIGHQAQDAYFAELAQMGVADTFSVLLCTTGGGYMWFGGYDSSFATGAPQFTPMSQGGYWNVNLAEIGLGTGDDATNLQGADKNAVVDTGTSLLYLQSAAYTALYTFLGNDPHATSVFGQGALGQDFFDNGSCITPTGNQTRADVDAALLPMTLQFPAQGGGSFTLVLPATQSYLFPWTSGGTTQYCAAVGDGGSSRGSTILGMAVIGANLTIFDIGRKRIGFAPQNMCN